MAKAVKYMVPPQPATNARFSLLLLEFGEILLQDWAVVVTMSDSDGDSGSNGASANSKSAPASQISARSNARSSKPPSASQRRNQSQRTKTNLSLQGRLHLCTKSLVFEPDEPLRAILRFPFNKMDASPQELGDTSPTASSLGDSYEFPLSVHFVSNRYWEMKENNKIGPYEMNYSSHVQITFLHSSPPTFVQLCKVSRDMELTRPHVFITWTWCAHLNRSWSVLRTAHLPHHKQRLTTNPSPDDLEDILKPMLHRPFDLSHLKSFGESPITPSLRAHWISPLQKQPGALMVTTEGVYFQMATLAEEGGLVTNWPRIDVVAYARRYDGLKDSAVEIYWRDGTSTLFAVEKARDREKIVQALGNKRCLTDRDFVVQALEEWNAGRLTNLDYLLALNAAAGRTFHDLSRYPVVPWVLSDYTSETLDLTNPKSFRDLTKPIGALEEKRLSYFQSRLQGMQQDGMPADASFLYGTHYSAPGYILYYLVRSMPQHMLCLQNGKFDSPDRMFFSIQQCFDCALTNHADVKELIPQFYLNYDFLINAQSLQLGATQLGDRVHDVLLPPWARSARDFVKQNRKALESKYASAKLPQWIDLIFGCRSRGELAREAQNLFHPSAYLGPADLETLQSEEERFQAELQAAEFGTVPDQLFENAHPMKGKVADAEFFVSATMGKVSHGLEGLGEHSKQEAWELLEPPSSASQEENIGFTDSQEENTKRSTSTVSFGAAMMPTLTMTKQSSNKPTPIQNTDSTDSATDEPNGLITPRGKAKASWETSNLTVPADVGTPLETQRAVNYRPEYALSDELMLPNTTTSTQPLGRRDLTQYRAIGLSGSGELSSRSKELSFGAAGSVETKKNQRLESPMRSVPSKVNNDIRAGWDLKMLEKKKLHNDAVSGCSLLFHVAGSYLTTVSLDGTLLVNTITFPSTLASPYSAAEDLRRGFTGTLSRFYASGPPQVEKVQSTLSAYRSHTASDPLACLSVTDDGYGGHLVFAGGHDDVVLAYGINSACAVASVYSHRDAVTGLDVIARSPLVQTSSLWSDMATHIMVSGSWDATVKVWSVAVSAGETVSINREPLAELFDADSTIVCLSATYVPGTGVGICTGCSDGSFVVWLIHDDGTKVVIHKEPSRRGAGPCAAVKWTKDQGETFLFAGFSNGRLSSFLLAGGNLIKVSAVSVGVSVTCLEYAQDTLLVGCADGGLRLLPIRDGASFDGKPTLWNAVNGLTSPGLVCCSIGFHDGRFLCSTGAEDGSVATFEL